MKNKMEIREDPKFLMTNQQGVLTLNIRRPSPFDSGTYSCRALVISDSLQPYGL